MVRTLTVVIGVAMSLLGARDASAIPITPVDFDQFSLGDHVLSSFLGSHTGLFGVANPPPFTMGEISSEVFLSSVFPLYTYVHTVTPGLDNNKSFTVQYRDDGFIHSAGFSFSDVLRAAGSNPDEPPVEPSEAISIDVDEVNFRFTWAVKFTEPTCCEPFSPGWDALEPITFFFMSSLPPGKLKAYNLVGRDGVETGTATSLAPVPEPGSIALLGSGLMGLYAAVRRRRSQKE